MPRFFASAADVSDGRAVLTGDDAAHLARSLRATPGEHIVVATDDGREHGVRLVAVDAARVEGAVEWSRDATGEPRIEVHMVQAIAKDGMDDVVEALAETGAAAIWPVTTRRTVVRLDARRAEHRVARWNAIARSAAGLAGRAVPPVVHAVHDLDALPLAGMRVIACTLDAPMPLARLDPAPRPGERIALCIGPEGGFDPADLDVLRRAGAEEAHLGPRVLRARLAGVLALSALLASAGELDTPVAGWPEEAATR